MGTVLNVVEVPGGRSSYYDDSSYYSHYYGDRGRDKKRDPANWLQRLRQRSDRKRGGTTSERQA